MYRNDMIIMDQRIGPEAGWFAKKNLLVVSRTSSVVITPL